MTARPMTDAERVAWEWQATPAEPGAFMAQLLTRWRVDPVLFTAEALRCVLMPYQQHMLLDLADAPAEVYAFHGLPDGNPKRQVLAPSGHGLGKTRLQALALWWHMLSHAFSRRIVTAPTSDQITKQLWGEVRKLYRRLKRFWPELAAEWEVQTAQVVHVNPEFGDWITVARTARAEEPEGLQGAHALDEDDVFGDLSRIFAESAEHTPSGGILVVVEEASGVDDAIRKVLQGALSEEGARFLACGNPTRPDGWFAADIARTDRYAVHCLDCRMSDRTQVYAMRYRDFGGVVHDTRIRGFVRPEYWQEVLADCDGDEDKDEFRVRVRGLVPRSAQRQVIRTHWVDQAQTRMPQAGAPGVVGLDFGVTGDRHALAVRLGSAIVEVEDWLPPDRPEDVTLQAAERAIEAVEQYRGRIRYIVGDSNGVGRGAMEYLTRYYRDQQPQARVTVVHFNAGAGALDRRRYSRRRDEMWFKAGRAFLSDPACSLPPDTGLARELTVAGYTEDTARRIQVESKKDIERRTGQPSGNKADAVLMTLMVPAHATAAHTDAAPEAADPLPEVFRRHFERWRARRGIGGGHLIGTAS